MDLQGNLRFGPDVEWVDEVNYVVRFAKGLEFGNWSLTSRYAVAGSEQSGSLQGAHSLVLACRRLVQHRG